MHAAIWNGCSRRSRLPAGGRTATQELQRRSRGTLGLLSEFGAALVQIDEPNSGYRSARPCCRTCKTFYYMRLHGRNAAQWWKHDKSEDRYNYLYSATELDPIADAAEEARTTSKKAYLYANNHFSAKSVANAATIKNEARQPLPGEYPEAFVERIRI